MFKKFLSLALVGILALSAFAKGESKYVAVQKAQLKAKASSSAKTVCEVAYGDVVSVVSESGKWTLVAATGKASGQGWIRTTALSKRKIVAGKKVSTDAKELSLAGKGFSEGIEAEYSKSSSADYTAVDSVEANSISDAERTEFVENGKLKEAE